MDPASSTAVLREARAGSDAALDTLYERFGPRLLSFIRLKLGRSLRALVALVAGFVLDRRARSKRRV